MTQGPTERLDAALAGRYRIERKLGEGGMASVYLAEDLKHERNVALKILRPELAAVIGAERFLAEIKTTANLQHPHILPLFDSGEADGFLYYVMPYIEGESLREKLDREQQLGVEEAVRIAREVGDALDYAHRKDIIHRDIKPANILLHDGRPVVADFGIALAVSAAGGGRMTETGLSLGTPHYMSPEQASADRDLSARSDVYSLGCVLYEMLAGQPPHTGPSAQNILVRILTETPRTVSELRHTVPPNVAAVVMKAIEKLPADRFDSAGEFVAALGDPAFRYTPAAPARTTRPAAFEARPAVETRGRTPLLASIAVAAVAIVLAAVGWLRPPQPLPVRRVVTTLDSAGNGGGPGPNAALSPDGSRVVYTGARGTLLLRSLSALESSEVAETAGAQSPFFSPRGDRVGFHRERTTGISEFATVSLVGGPPVQLAQGDFFPGGTWSDDGYIYFADDPGTLLRVSQEGGVVETVADSTSGYWFQWPEALPGGHALLVGTWDGAGEGGPPSLVGVTTADGAVRPVLEGFEGPQRPTQARYAGGYLFWRTANRTLMAAPFDDEALELTGEPIALSSSLSDVGPAAGEFDVSEDGTLLYAVSGSGLVGLGETMTWVSREGAATPVDERLGQEVGDFDFLRLSPGATHVAAEIQPPDADDLQVWIYDLAQRTLVRLSLEGRVNTQPRWLDDDRVAYIARGRFDGESAIVAQSIDGGAETVLFRSTRDIAAFAPAPIDRSLAVTLEDDSDGTVELVRVDPDGTGDPVPFVSTRFEEGAADFSPDGRWVAYVSNVSGRSEIYVAAWPEGDRRSAISIAGGEAPRWSPTGEELFYMGGTQMMVAELEISDRVSVVSRTALFELAPFEAGGPVATYDVVDGGERLLVISEGTGGRLDRHILVLNVFEELRRRGAR